MVSASKNFIALLSYRKSNWYKKGVPAKPHWQMYAR